MWKEVSGMTDQTWDPKEENEIEGTLTGRKIGVGENKSNIYIIENKEGKKISVWGSTVLDIKMTDVPEGAKVKIIFEGLKDSPKRKGKKYKDFKVMIDTEYIDKNETARNEESDAGEIEEEEIPYD